jgi:hypothetical protein
VSNIADLLITTERQVSFNNVQHVQRSSSPSFAQKTDRDTQTETDRDEILRATGYGAALCVCTFTNRTFRYLLPAGVQVYGAVSRLEWVLGFRFPLIGY